ncbi:hypothetical protein NDU88_005069 [Pleurodeles waltl]|uniref:Uncharacterized protein n=1 Tax=Pleurodeles waltl TaxID=8319 RepID=A0AAV7PHG7_PLEWA|nr:hypothetical protein NDU88_005069 [Pleurodeles waltl]
MSSSVLTTNLSSTYAPENPCPDTTMERILREISAVGLCLEAMDSKITDLSADSSRSEQTLLASRIKSRI